MPSVPSIVPQSITGQKTPRDPGDGHRPRTQKEVKVVWNQAQGIANGFRLPEDSPQSLHKVIPVGIVPEYRTPFNTPDHDMAQDYSRFDQRFPWHEKPLSP
jgi:hypothetical protein